MSSWYSSWFSGLPTFDFAVPSSIQRRFFSFLLRRTLGHFLKPGQLDLHQIDSQLGSGTVQVNDLELDGKAIDQLLVGFPLSLYDGFISGVTARIPFPNPLSSVVGLHVQSLRLTFQITPDHLACQDNSNLADSVVSISETFIHDELSPREEAALRQTVKPSVVLFPPVEESENLPGGFNPLGHDLDAGEAHNEPRGDHDPTGVSIFATLIERLLAKFEFSAVDTKVTVVYPGRASFTLSISEMTYHAESGLRSEINDGIQSSSEGRNRCGQVHRVSISGLKVTSQDLSVVPRSPTIPSTQSSVSFTSSQKSSSLYNNYNSSVNRSSRNSSSSSLDEDTQLVMSQSIAMLPPTSPHLLSASSSMYQSAVSSTYPHSTQVDAPSAALSVLQRTDSIDGARRARTPPVSVPWHDPAENVLLYFGSQPIVISLQTPSRRTRPSEQTARACGNQPADKEVFIWNDSEQETLRLSVTFGTLACAFRSSHLRVLLDIVDAFASRSPVCSRVSHEETSSVFPHASFCLEGNIVSRGIVVIALPEPSTGEIFFLGDLYERPLVPPRLPCPYLRLFVDTLSISFRLARPSPQSPVSGSQRTSSSMSLDRSTFAKLVVSDISLFCFQTLSSVDGSHTAAPVLITDHYLPTLHVAHHYRPWLASDSPSDIKLPKFEVVDWTQTKLKSGSAKLSTWRSRNRAASGKADKSRTPSQRSKDLPRLPNPFIPSPPSRVDDTLQAPPAIEALCRLPSSSPKGNSLSVDVKIAPLHLFFDLDTIFRDNLFMQFVEDIMSSAIFMPKSAVDLVEDQSFPQKNSGEANEDDEDIKKDVRIPAISRRVKEREEEGRRLEALVLEDFNLGINYHPTAISEPMSSKQHSTLGKKTIPSKAGLCFHLTCPMVRAEVRCLYLLPHLPRSGGVLFDFIGLTISNDSPSTKSPLRLSEGMNPSPPRSNNFSNVILSICLQEILIAYSSVGDHVAHTILTLSFLPNREVPDTNVLLSTETKTDTLPLSVMLGRPYGANKSLRNPPNTLSMTVHIPLVNLVMDKVSFDELQCWADSVARLIGRTFAPQESATETLLTRNPSLVGSRYFAQPRLSGSHSTEESVVAKSGKSASETLIKVAVTEVLLRIIVPRNGESYGRPLDISALDLDALIELRQEGKEECVITAGIMDLRIADMSNEGEYVLLIHSPVRSLSSPSRPSVKSRITSLVIPETTAKESRIKISLCGLIVHPPLDVHFGNDLATFAKAPPGVFDSVVPSECTRLTVEIVDVSVHLCAPGHPGAAVLHLGGADFSTKLMGSASDFAFDLSVSSSHIFLVDSIQDAFGPIGTTQYLDHDIEFWKNSGYALITEISHSQLAFRADNTTVPPNTSVVIKRIGLRICLCADTISALTGLINSITRSTSRDGTDISHSHTYPKMPNTIIGDRGNDMTASLDEHAFRLIPEVGSTADMVSDDLPANQDYLDSSFGTAAGLRELRDDDLEDFDMAEQSGSSTPVAGQLGIVSNVGGETVRILKPFSFIEHYFDTISPEVARDSDSDTTLRIRIYDSDVALFLYDGFDWPRTRKIIEKEVKDMRKKLARIRQLVATGQTQESIDETTTATLFNSFHIGLERDLDAMDPDTLVAAIDDELDDSAETGTEGSWQSLHPVSPGRPRVTSTRVYGKRLTRSRAPSIEIRLEGLHAEIDNYPPGGTLVSRTLILVRDFEILDHIRSSTWKKFLTDMRSDSRGNIRETESNMARVELLSVRPSPSHLTEEARLRAKILPLRLYVDQDALDFFKRFFAFQDSDSPSAPQDGEKKEEIYFQHAEVFPVDIKLDYKPRRVDYRALRDGKTIELMNFFHFDGAEMTLRHLTLHGITGWPRFFDTLNDLWTPDVKATQLVDVISGVAPIRSVVNVGSGVADLVLLPIAQYKKDGRIVRGVQKGTKAFVQSTAMEAVKLGARLATGTQVILERAENVLGGQFNDAITAEALQIPYEIEDTEDSGEDLISRYATQPTGLKEGVQSAYRSLQRNLHSAAQTILAVPMEIYERSGNEGAVRAVVRAVPIAVLKPMIGASEAVSKTLMGLHNTLDPNVRLENEAKYKHR